MIDYNVASRRPQSPLHRHLQHSLTPQQRRYRLLSLEDPLTLPSTQKTYQPSINSSIQITQSEVIDQNRCIRVNFRSREEALNCLDLNGIYYVSFHSSRENAPSTLKVLSLCEKSHKLRPKDAISEDTSTECMTPSISSASNSYHPSNNTKSSTSSPASDQ